MTDSPLPTALRPSDAGPLGDAAVRYRSLPPPRRRGMFWVAILTALAAVVAGAVVTVTALVNESAPESAAVAYFHALARGDAAGALGLGAVPAGEHTYLTRDVLQLELKIAKIGGVRVLSVDRVGGTAEVTVRYVLSYRDRDPIMVTDAVTTLRRGRGWRLAKTAVPVHLAVESGQARMSIGGAPVPTRPVLFFPGALPIGFDTPNLYLKPPVVVHLNGTLTTSIRPAVSPAGSQAIIRAIAADVSTCVSGTTSAACLAPDDPPGVVPGSVRGTIEGGLSDLRIDVEPGANGLLQIDGTVDVNGTYQQLDFNNQPVRKTGPVQLEIKAQCYATSPDKLIWDATR
jgi:hypothetical protein